jgi:acyl-CoA reductase-like NAD-dependent aldehyde dehydrogenase
VKDGATLALGGGMLRPPGLPGHFFQPTILTDVRHGSVATREEIFGPVLSITTVADADEAIRFANDSEYGLGASIYTKDLATAMRAMESIKAGTFWINDPLTDNDAAPFGGMRHSGIGRELGPEGVSLRLALVARQILELDSRQGGSAQVAYHDRLQPLRRCQCLS